MPVRAASNLGSHYRSRLYSVRILILKPSSLGDVVQAIPVLRLVKRQWPGAEIFWWVDASLSPLLEGDPDLAGIFRFHRKRWGSPRYWNEAVASIRDLRRYRFDLVLDLQALARSAVLARLTGGAMVVGLEDFREAAPAFYDRRIPRRTYETHAVDWYLDAARALGIPVKWDFDWLPVRPAEAAKVREAAAGVESWIALHPGARWLNKRWPVRHFTTLVKLLSVRLPSARFAVLGAGGDAALAAEVTAAAPDRCLDLTGQTSLPEMVEWLRMSRVLVTNDTGPMHVAAALGRPVVGIFGPTNPRRTGPYGQIAHALTSSLACAPCMSSHCHFERPIECLNAISPERVAVEVVARIGGGLAPPRS